MRYPTLEELRRLSEQAGLEVSDLEPFRRKTFSCLRLISEEAFAAGMARMTLDLEGRTIACVSRNYVMWSRKKAEKPSLFR